METSAIFHGSSHFAVRAEAVSLVTRAIGAGGMVSEEGGRPFQNLETLKVQLMGPNDIRSKGKSKLVLPLN